MVAALHSLAAQSGRTELKTEFVQLRAKGYPYIRIAERLGVAKSTLANWNADLEAEIATARANTGDIGHPSCDGPKSEALQGKDNSGRSDAKSTKSGLKSTVLALALPCHV